MRIAAIGDIHCRAYDIDATRDLLDGVQGEADVLAICGDLTDNGLPEEAKGLLGILKSLSMPVLAVLGNHDHEGGKAAEIKTILLDGGICLLEGTVHEIGDVGFVGSKGFCGGFGNCMVQPFGEDALKLFIRVGIDEAIQIENALTRLDCPHKVAILHYSPVVDTLHGEPPELFPFLGSERLANAIDRQGVDAIIHGHAHHGSPEGRTAGNIPVYNVSRFVQKAHRNRTYQLLEF